MHRTAVPTDDRSPSTACSWLDAGAVLIDIAAISRR